MACLFGLFRKLNKSFAGRAKENRMVSWGRSDVTRWYLQDKAHKYPDCWKRRALLEKKEQVLYLEKMGIHHCSKASIPIDLVRKMELRWQGLNLSEMNRLPAGHWVGSRFRAMKRGASSGKAQQEPRRDDVAIKLHDGVIQRVQRDMEWNCTSVCLSLLVAVWIALRQL